MLGLDTPSYTGGRRGELANSLLTQHLIGLRLFAPYQDTFVQDFAVLHPVVPHGSSLFVHGKELFTPTAAARYFSDQGHGQFPYSDFSEGPKQKLRRYLSPQGLSARLFDYDGSKDYADFARMRIQLLKEQYPGITLPSPDRINEYNASEYHEQIDQALEAHGVDLGQLRVKQDYPDASLHKNLAQQRKSYCRLLLKSVDRRFHGELFEELENHAWDPEIIRNFQAGLQAGADVSKHVSFAIAQGIEARTEALLRQAAEMMENPYDHRFTWPRNDMAHLLAQTVQPRILRDAIRGHTPVIIINDDSLKHCHDLVGFHATAWKNAGGVFRSKSPVRNAFSNDFIILACDPSQIAFSPAARKNARRLAQHEYEHRRDWHQESPFYAIDKAPILAALEHDRATFAEIKQFVREVPTSNEGRARLQELAKKCRLTYNDNDPNIFTTVMQVTQVLETIEKRADMLLHPADQTIYNSFDRQVMEIPAIMADLKGEFGTPLVRELMPQLYALFMQHRLQNHGLRDQPDMGRSR